MNIKPSKPNESKKQGSLQVNSVAEPPIATSLFNKLRELPVIKFKNILTTTDFSELSIEGLEYAISLADELGAALSLVNVVEPSVKLAGMESVILARSDDAIVKLEKRHLRKLAKKLARNARTMTPVTRYGKAFREITGLAKELKFDLIVTTTHGHTGLKRALIGSTAEWVVRHAPCPVLTVPAQIADRMSGKRWMSGIRKIVVPIDFSDTSTEALSYTVALAKRFKAEVILIHVTEPLPRGDDFDRRPFPAMDARARKSAEGLLLHARQEAFGDNVYADVMVRSGTPFREIVQAARRLDADLIVLTTHGHTGFKHVLLGSTAERIVRHATCPVLVVRKKNNDRSVSF